MLKPLSMKISNPWKSIADFQWHGIPPFAVITGGNGAGKSQLLETIAGSYGAYRNPNRRMGSAIDDGPPRSNVLIDGDKFEDWEVFHSASEWQPVVHGRPCSLTTINDLIASIRSHDNPRRQNKEWLARQIQTTVAELDSFTDKDLIERLTPTILWAHSFPGNTDISTLFWAYRLFERHARDNGFPNEKIVERYGEPPWDLMNEILRTSGLSFQLNPPPDAEPRLLGPTQQYTAELVDVQRARAVPFEQLSAGEKVIMSTAFFHYNAEHAGKHYRLLLLDEPDAHLHPSLTKGFLEVMQKVFVRDRNIRVIMTTHSPSTVALTPPESLFEMRRDGHPRILPTPKARLISLLTGGYVTVQDGTQTVFVEGQSDLPFFRLVWDLLTDRSGVTEPGPLDPFPNLNFIYGLGRDVIQAIVPQMRGKGLSNFHGLIDRDINNVGKTGVTVLGRNGKENYLYDPLIVYASLLENDKAPTIVGFEFRKRDVAHLHNLPVTHLQAIVNHICDSVAARYPPEHPSNIEVLDVEYGAKVLKYPKWFLTCDDHELSMRIGNVFQKFGVSEEQLMDAYAKVRMIPNELIDLLKKMQTCNLTATRE